MTHFDCVVDTEPMAQEMKSVSSQIKGTTAAVVGMRTAVIMAEEAAADHVCDNVNKGFYTLIHSQISQKIAKLQSEVDSHLMKLGQLRKQLLGIKDRMERDYGMISGRYLKLFSGLNKNLQQRVFELDKPTIEFAVKDTNTISNRMRLLTATVPVSQSESLSVSQRILISNMKYQGMRVVDSMSSFLAATEEQQKLTDLILLPMQTEKDSATYMIPVLVSESNIDKYGNKRIEIIVNRSKLTPRSQEAIRNAVQTKITQLEWEDRKVSDEIKSEFSKLLSATSSSQRVKDTANSLFMAHHFQTIKMQRP